jgi:hypothetical protein
MLKLLVLVVVSAAYVTAVSKPSGYAVSTEDRT